jgi:hypothetical protein
MKPIVPLTDVDRRMPEAGRIRLGEKSGKAMKSLDHLRFTSPRRDLIEQIAAQYGGKVTAWNEPKSSSPNQWQVTITADDVDVYLVPGGLNTQYEAWEGGGAARRCDGLQCEIPVQTADGWETTLTDCLCRAQNVALCKPYTRMSVILPTISFAGTWRLETKGWNAMHELPGMYDMISTLASSGQMVTARLGLEQRQKITRGGKRNFVVPRLTIAQTALEIQSGAANALAIQATGQPVATPALGSGTPHLAHDVALPLDEIIEAEIISDDELDAIANLHADAANFGLDPDRLVGAIRAGIRDQPNELTEAERMAAASQRIRAGVIEPLGFLPNGRVQWKVNS